MAINSSPHIEVIAGRDKVKQYFNSLKIGSFRRKHNLWRRRRWWVSGNEFFGRRCLLVSSTRGWQGNTVLLFPSWMLVIVEFGKTNFIEIQKPIIVVKHGFIKTTDRKPGSNSHVQKLRRQGMVPAACEICGDSYDKCVAHHWNGYDNPADVWWICHSCNTSLSGPEWHSGLLAKDEVRALFQNDQTTSSKYGRRRKIRLLVIPPQPSTAVRPEVT